MFYNLIHFKGTEKRAGIRTKEPLKLEELTKSEIVSITDDSTTEVTQFRPADVLRINTVDESMATAITTPALDGKKKQPKGMKIS